MKNSLDIIDLKDNRINIARGKNWFFNLGSCNITWKYYCVRKKFSYCNKKVLVFFMFFEIGLMPKNSYHRDWRLPRRCSTFLYLKGLPHWGHVAMFEYILQSYKTNELKLWWVLQPFELQGHTATFQKSLISFHLEPTVQWGDIIL